PPLQILAKAGSTAEHNHAHLWLWVPAFAGTTCDIFNTTGKSPVLKTRIYVKSRSKKYFCLRAPQITCLPNPILPDERGVTRTCRTRGRLRWTWAASLTIEAACGRQSRGGLAPRRWCLAYGKQ